MNALTQSQSLLRQAEIQYRALPQDWLSGLMEWPRSVGWMEQLGNQLDRVIQTGVAEKPCPLFPLSLLLRNLGFLGIVLFHGFRRLLPPY